jgi:site-specific recombinase XerD
MQKQKIMSKNFTIQTNSFKLLYEGYDKFIRASKYKQRGEMYQMAVKEFLHYLESQEIFDIKKVKASTMVAYFEYLTVRPKLVGAGVLSSSSVSGHMFSLKMFQEHLLDDKKISQKIILPKLPKRDQNQRNILSQDEVSQLIETCENKRDIAILCIAYGCGARRSEIESLCVSDIQLSKGFLIVRSGKFGKRREIPMSSNVIAELKDYLVNERHLYLRQDKSVFTDAFLVNNKGKRMRGEHINERLKELVQKTRNEEMIAKQISLHALRHSIAVALLDNGATIDFVKDFLGHKGIDTSHIYSRRRRFKSQMIKNLQR